jgi:hypothetical protein
MEPPKRRHPKKRRNNPKDALDFGRNFTHLTPEKKVLSLKVFYLSIFEETDFKTKAR